MIFITSECRVSEAHQLLMGCTHPSFYRQYGSLLPSNGKLQRNKKRADIMGKNSRHMGISLIVKRTSERRRIRFKGLLLSILRNAILNVADGLLLATIYGARLRGSNSKLKVK